MRATGRSSDLGNDSPQTSVSNVVILNTIGRGSYGEVFSIKDQRTGCLYAMKSMYLEDSRSFVKELELLHNKKLVNPHLVKYYSQFSDNTKAYMVMEYCSQGSLDKWMETQPKPISEIVILKVFVQSIDGLYVLHNNGFVHGDIKPQNLLLNNENEVKISDFGTTRKMNETLSSLRQTTISTSSSIHGTVGFIPAEVIRGFPISPAADVFALGCTLYVAMTGRRPFAGVNELATIPLVLEGRFSPIEEKYSERLKTLIYQMLDKDPAKRPTLKQLMTETLLVNVFRSIPTPPPVLPPPNIVSVPQLSTPAQSLTNSNANVRAGCGSSGRSSSSRGGGDELAQCEGCENSMDDMSIICTHNHHICGDCLLKAARATVRAQGTRVPCVKDDCSGRFVLEMLRDNLPPKMYAQLSESLDKNVMPSPPSTLSLPSPTLALPLPSPTLTLQQLNLEHSPLRSFLQSVVDLKEYGMGHLSVKKISGKVVVYQMQKELKDSNSITLSGWCHGWHGTKAHKIKSIVQYGLVTFRESSHPETLSHRRSAFSGGSVQRGTDKMKGRYEDYMDEWRDGVFLAKGASGAVVYAEKIECAATDNAPKDSFCVLVKSAARPGSYWEYPLRKVDDAHYTYGGFWKDARNTSNDINPWFGKEVIVRIQNSGYVVVTGITLVSFSFLRSTNMTWDELNGFLNEKD